MLIKVQISPLKYFHFQTSFLKGVGAACGRIHPTGSGFMQWYQKFEYAIGHWLQKSTEHVMGCVLCSPGCFSLFRGEALMDENVMNTSFYFRMMSSSHL